MYYNKNHTPHSITLKHIAAHCNTQQLTPTRYNTLQHAATTLCNTLQHAESLCLCLCLCPYVSA